MRSLRAFERCGFDVAEQASVLVTLSLKSARYRQLLQDGEWALAPKIYITEVDRTRLLELIWWQDGPALADLEHELERAVVVQPHEVAPQVITVNSKVRLTIDGEPQEVALVYHEDSNERCGRYSVLSDLGAAILGHREGDAIDWLVVGRPRRIAIGRVLYQPEAAGDFHL